MNVVVRPLLFTKSRNRVSGIAISCLDINNNIKFIFSDENTSIQITKEDDIFAFGTLIFEIFAGFLPFDNEKPKSSLSLSTDISQKIKCDQIHDQLRNFPSNKAEKLKRVISACWHSQKHHRISLSELTANFTPGNCLVRRHSISEPQLDKILCSTYLNK